MTDFPPSCNRTLLVIINLQLIEYALRYYTASAEFHKIFKIKFREPEQHGPCLSLVVLDNDFGAARCVGVVQVDSHHVVRLLDVLVHAAPVREDSITELAGELFPVVQGLPVRLEVALAAEGLPALGAGVDLRHARVFLLPVPEEGALALEDLATIEARKIAHGAVVLTVVLRDVGHGYKLRKFHRSLKIN